MFKLQDLASLSKTKDKPIDDLLKGFTEETLKILDNRDITIESKSALAGMHLETMRLSKIKHPYKNEKIARLLVGGIIFVLAFEDYRLNYAKENRQYPSTSLKELFQKFDEANPEEPNQNENSEEIDGQGIYRDHIITFAKTFYKELRGANKNSNYIAFMNWLGTQAMSDQIPFNSDLLKKKVLTIVATNPVSVFSELAANSTMVDQLISSVKPVIKFQLRPEYVSAYKHGAAIGFFSTLKPALPLDIIKHIAKNLLNKQDAYNMARTTRKARIHAIEAREEAIKNDTPNDSFLM